MNMLSVEEFEKFVKDRWEEMIIEFMSTLDDSVSGADDL